MCIKEIIFELANEIDARLSSISIPAAILEWRFNIKKKPELALAKSLLSVKMTKKEIDDLVSGNVYKTKDALALFGIDLGDEKDQWDFWKDAIQTIVTRRNNIVHHNDYASDISLGDIKIYIRKLIEYIDFIVNACLVQSFKLSAEIVRKTA